MYQRLEQFIQKKIVAWKTSQLFFLLLLIVCIILTLAVEHFALFLINTQTATQYPLLSRRFFVKAPNDIILKFNPLRKQIQDYTATLPFSFGVYFEYLPTGISIGENANDTFISASLLKVPYVMAVYNKFEDGTLHPTDTVIIQQNDLDKGFGDAWQKGAGGKITLQEAIDLTLIKSDNTAKNVLADVLQEDDLKNLFDSVDIPNEIDMTQASVSPKNYASVLKSLYFASYLSKNSSQEILDDLTKTPFDDGIAADIPKHISVAHKIGVYDDGVNVTTHVFSDCGIIYVPLRQYILCVMGKGNEQDVKKAMRNIAKITYTYIHSAKIDDN